MGGEAQPWPHNFGIVRLKLVLALVRCPELDTPGWQGQFQAAIGPGGQVKAAAHQALGEVRLTDDP